MKRLASHLFAILGVAVAGGCAGSSSCAGCGYEPLPDGYPEKDRVDNAVSARITKSGFEFVNDNAPTIVSTILGAPGGKLTFPIPEQKGSKWGQSYAICYQGPKASSNPPHCIVEIDVSGAKVTLAPGKPHNLKLTGTIPIRMRKLPIHIDTTFGDIDMDATFTGNGGCPGSTQSAKATPVNVSVSLEIDQNQSHVRAGYTRVVIDEMGSSKAEIEKGLKFCGKGAGDDFANFFRGQIVDFVYDRLLSTLRGRLDEFLCQKARKDVDPSCPSGTNDVKGICRYGSSETSECASLILGGDGHVDLGDLLSSISPGTEGALDFLAAAGGEASRDDGSGFSTGDLNPVNGGMTLGMYGGAKASPLSGCVTPSKIPLPKGIPTPAALEDNDLPGWPSSVPGPHFGIGLSERFANYALGGVYDSGLLCLQISTEDVPLLNTATLGLLDDSVTELGLQKEPQQLAIAVRPTKPPEVEFGGGTDIKTDPLVRVKLPAAAFDFYAFSLDRFARFMTVSFDVDVPVNLSITPKGLVPVLSTVGVTNGKITNNELLRGDPDQVAAAIGQLLGSQVSQALGAGIDPIDIQGLFESLGLELVIPETVDGKGSPGLRKISKGDEDFLGVFASFAMKGSKLTSEEADTTAELVGKEVDPEGLRVLSITRDNGPKIRLRVGSTLEGRGAPVEYSYRVDTGLWKPFTRESDLLVEDDWLRVEGRHKIEVRSRLAGEPMTLDPTPAEIDVVVDARPPVVELGELEEGSVPIDVFDIVSAPEAIEVRYRLDEGDWSAWMPSAELSRASLGEAVLLDVEARDEEGNVGEAQHGLIRDGEASAAGCGCVAAGEGGEPGRAASLGGLAALGALAFFSRRRRRAARGSGGARRLLRGAACGALVLSVGAFSGCSCGDETVAPGDTGGGSGPACEGCKSLGPGLTGSYTSAAVDGDVIWVSGYSEADWGSGAAYGDLVVGTWNEAAGGVDWESVDGVPSEPAVDPERYDVGSFRGGQTEPGDDVGLWTSLAIVGEEPAVAYYDRTNKALKYARRTEGGWESHVVDAVGSGDVGRYAKLVVLGGLPVIAYLAVEADEDGKVTSQVKVARATSADPGSGDWSMEEVFTTPKTVPCRAPYCAAGEVCVEKTRRCQEKQSGCDPSCKGGAACVDVGGELQCAGVIDSTKLDAYPPVVGAYVAAAPDGDGGLGLAFYDRLQGELLVARETSSGWSVRTVDDDGDVGVGASLAITGDGDWHLTYVDAVTETLRYLRLPNGTGSGTPELVDDGLEVDGDKFPDGKHVVGDDSFVFVTPSGEVHVTYQDATSGTLRYAVGSPSGSKHSWKLRAIEADGFGGAFSRILQVDGSLRLLHWSRVGQPSAAGFVTILSP